jgi:hypothetical protein
MFTVASDSAECIFLWRTFEVRDIFGALYRNRLGGWAFRGDGLANSWVEHRRRETQNSGSGKPEHVSP